MKISLLTILIPIYNEEECIFPLYKRLASIAGIIKPSVEILFVNDGSVDSSLSIIRGLQEMDTRVSYVDLSRNFGKEKAMCAGIHYVHGDALTIIDADLQDPPELIPEMLEELEKGYDDVYACRSSRKGETWLKQWTANNYYRCLHLFANIPVQENTGDFRMFSAKAIRALQEIKECELNMKGIFSYIGFKKKPIYYERDVRIAGKTKWNYFKLIDLALKGLTSFSVLPLRIVSFLGSIVSVVAFIYLIKVLLKALFWGDPVEGYPSLMCVLLFLGGFILLALGVVGEYLGVIYSETKKRPVYYINEYHPGISNIVKAKDKALLELVE